MDVAMLYVLITSLSNCKGSMCRAHTEWFLVTVLLVLPLSSDTASKSDARLDPQRSYLDKLHLFIWSLSL